jgi:Family of unknown function (DUF6098)
VDPDADADAVRDDLPEVGDLRELVELVGRSPTTVYVRWSRGPASDAGECSHDHASGLDLPGLAVNPLTPPSWWTRPAEEWVARQITAYDHLGNDAPDHVAWVLTGRIVERGPDNEPLVVDVRPLVRLAPAVLAEAAARQPRSDRDEDDDTSWRS